MTRIYQTPMAATNARLRSTIKLAMVTVLFLVAALAYCAYRNIQQAHECALPFGDPIWTKPAKPATGTIEI